MSYLLHSYIQQSWFGQYCLNVKFSTTEKLGLFFSVSIRYGPLLRNFRFEWRSILLSCSAVKDRTIKTWSALMKICLPNYGSSPFSIRLSEILQHLGCPEALWSMLELLTCFLTVFILTRAVTKNPTKQKGRAI